MAYLSMTLQFFVKQTRVGKGCPDISMTLQPRNIHNNILHKYVTYRISL